MEGRPVQVIAATVKKEGESVSADELAVLLSAALLKVEEWQAGLDRPASSAPNG
jgi:hypothetical protein